MAGLVKALRLAGLVAPALAIVCALAGGVAAQPAVAAGGPCSSTSPPNHTYSASVCLSVPQSPARGPTQITATVTLSKALTLVSYVTFCLDGSATGGASCIGGGPGYLLRAFEPTTNPAHGTTTWTFTLPAGHWVDGDHRLLAVAQLADGTQTDPVTATLAFSNGRTAQAINGASPTFVRPTQPAAGKPLVVAAVGDGGGDDAASAGVSRLIAGWSPNLFLYLGDVYDQGAYAEFTNWYDRSFGVLRSITAPVPGNHEYMSASDPATAPNVLPNGTAYFDYWNNLPNFYSFDAGGWHFIALNANPQMGQERWENQLAWLADDESKHASACTIAFWHEPAFNSGTAETTPEAKRLWSLVAGHVALVLNAHDHTYQRWEAMDAAGRPSPTGTPEIVAGTGGHQPTNIVSADPRRSAQSTSPGALRIALHRSSARVEFITTAGAIGDATTVACTAPSHAAGATSATGSGGGGAGQSTGATTTPRNDVGGLEIAFVLATALAAAGYVLVSLPAAAPVALLAASIAVLAAATLRQGALPPPATDLAVVGAVLGAGWALGRILPRRRAPMFLLLGAIAAAVIAIAVGGVPIASLARAPAPWLSRAGAPIGVTTLGLSLLMFAGVLAVAIAVHSARRGLALAAAIVPPAIALVLAGALALAIPRVPGISLAAEWPALIAPLLGIGWIATEATLSARRPRRARPVGDGDSGLPRPARPQARGRPPSSVA